MSTRAIAYPADRPFGYAELVEFVTERLGDGSVLLLGESFSGPIAVEVAARVPQQVKGLILAASFLTPPLLPFLIRIGARIDVRWMPKSVVHLFLRGRRRDPELAGEIDALMGSLPAEVISARLSAVSKVDARRSFRSLGHRLIKPQPDA